MRKLALLIFLTSLLLGGTYYFAKSRGFEQYRIKPLDAQSSIKKKYQININLASAREFENLPGIGPALAERIVDDREKRGSFRSVEDISRVKGIGEKKMGKFRKYLVV